MLLYSRYIIWQLMILIFGRSYLFSDNSDVFPGISCMINNTFPKMGDSVFTSFYMLIFWLNFTLQPNIFILDDCLYISLLIRSSAVSLSSLSSMTWWCYCIFSIPFLVSHFTNPTALDFLDWIAILIAPSKLMKISWGFSLPPSIPKWVLVWPGPSISVLVWV